MESSIAVSLIYQSNGEKCQNFPLTNRYCCPHLLMGSVNTCYITIVHNVYNTHAIDSGSKNLFLFPSHHSIIKETDSSNSKGKKWPEKLRRYAPTKGEEDKEKKKKRRRRRKSRKKRKRRLWKIMEHHGTSWIIMELKIENWMQIDNDWPSTSFSFFLSFSLFFSPFHSFSLFFV